MHKLFEMYKINRKNAKLITLLLGALSGLFIVILVVFEIMLFRLQVETQESRNMQRLNLSFENEILNYVNIAKFLSTVELVEVHYPIERENYEEYADMEKNVNSVLQTNFQIASVYMQNGDKVYNSSPTDEFIEENADYLGEVNTIHLYSLHRSTEGKMDYYVKYDPLLDKGNTVFLKINSTSFSNQILKEVDDRTAYITNSEGVIAFALKNSQIGQNAKDIFKVGFKPENYTELKKDGIVSAEQIGESGLYFVLITDFQFYSTSFIQNIIIILSITILFVFASALVTFFINKITYKPFERILTTIGNTDSFLPTAQDDGLSYILGSIQRFKDENASLNEEVKNALTELKYQQMVSCQSQICPHFISNTLSTVSCMAIEESGDHRNPITFALNDLSIILRSTLELNVLVTTIAEEIKVTEKYVNILKLRYGETVKVIWDVEPSLYENYILKFSLQPLIENAANHAFDYTEKEQIIKVSIRAKEKEILVTVSDNGFGIAEADLKDIRTRINDFGSVTAHNVGLRNINHRIKLLYSDTYGLSITSESGEGTVCSFSYPM